MTSKTEIQPPDWLDQTFLQTSLRKGLNDESLEIQEFKIKPAVAVGDNYASHIFRTTLTIIKHGQTQNLHLIIKSLPAGEVMIDAVHEMNIFKEEAKMLMEVVPKMHQLILDAGVKCTDKFAAKCFYFQGEPRDLLILEDLCESGYKLGKRLEGLDKDHALLVVQSLASYHAGMYALLQKEPKYKTECPEPVWGETQNDKTIKMVEGAVHCMADVAAKWTDYPPKYAEKLRKLEKNILKQTNATWKLDESFKFNTMTHGDCWLNNMMFRYGDDGKVNGHVFVDFQMPSYSSPLLDLVYFMFTSIRHEVRKAHLNTFVEIYYKQLVYVLKQLGHDIDLTLDDIKKEFQNKLFFGFVSALVVLPVVITPPDKALDVENAMNPDSEYNNQHLYENSKYQEIIKDLLPFFEQHGVL